MGVSRPFEAIDPAHDVVIAEADLFGAKTYRGIVRVGEDDGKMIPTRADEIPSATTAAIGPDRLRIEEPTYHIERMNVLFGNDIAGECTIQRPIPQPQFPVLGIGSDLRVAFGKHGAR